MIYLVFSQMFTALVCVIFIQGKLNNMFKVHARKEKVGQMLFYIFYSSFWFRFNQAELTEAMQSYLNVKLK